MYHSIKSGKKKRHKRKLVLKLCFLLTAVWAGMLWLLSILPPTGPREDAVLMYRGERRSVASGQTVGEALEALGLQVTAEDVISLPLEVVLSPGSQVTVNRHQTRQEVYTISIPPETEYRLDSTLPWGREAELLAGTAGEMRCAAQVDYVNGQEVHRVITGRQLLSPAQNQIIAVGTCENPIPTAASGYLWLPEGQLLTYTHTAAVEATGFTAADPGAFPGAAQGTVAVDPDFIAPGTRLYIVSSDGSFTYGIAQARASDSMEGNRIDLFFPTAEAQAEFGRRGCTVYFLG